MSKCNGCLNLLTAEHINGVTQSCTLVGRVDTYNVEVCSHFKEIPDRKEIMELSNKAEEELKTGDEPRKYKKCKYCQSKLKTKVEKASNTCEGCIILNSK